MNSNKNQIKTKILCNKISFKLAYIIGVAWVDGYIYLNKERGRIGLEAKDKDFVLRFKKELESWSKRKAILSFRKKRNIHCVILNSTKHTKLLKNFRITTILESEKKIKYSFLNGLFDSEGGITGDNLDNRKKAKRWIHFSNSDKKMIEYVISILDESNINYHLRSRIHSGFGSEKLQYEILIYGLRNLLWFHKNKIFSIKRKVDKLKEVIQSYDYYPTYMLDKAKELNKKIGYKKVADKINVPRGVVYGWLFKNNQKQILDVEV